MGGRTGSLVALRLLPITGKDLLLPLGSMLHKILCVRGSRSQIATSSLEVNVARKTWNLTTLIGRVKILGVRAYCEKKTFRLNLYNMRVAARL